MKPANEAGNKRRSFSAAEIATIAEKRNYAIMIKRQKRASLNQPNYMKTEDVKPDNVHNIVNDVKPVIEFEKSKINSSCLNDQTTLLEHDTLKGMNETEGVKPDNDHSSVSVVKPVKDIEKPKCNTSCLNDQTTLAEHNTSKGMNVKMKPCKIYITPMNPIPSVKSNNENDGTTKPTNEELILNTEKKALEDHIQTNKMTMGLQNLNITKNRNEACTKCSYRFQRDFIDELEDDVFSTMFEEAKNSNERTVKKASRPSQLSNSRSSTPASPTPFPVTPSTKRELSSAIDDQVKPDKYNSGPFKKYRTSTNN